MSTKSSAANNVPMLYRSPGCGSAMVEAAFALADKPLDRFTASRWDSPDRLKALERVNPLGQVPTLVWPDGTVQTESIAILIEIALRYPEAQLLPSGLPERATALRWLLFLGTTICASFNPRDFPERWCRRARNSKRWSMAQPSASRPAGR